MSSSNTNVFTKENLDTYLKALAKEFRKSNKTTLRAEITLIGGAAILVNYGFRGMTTDIDAIIHASSSMKDAINRIADKYNLPNGWLNSDFMHTDSYSSKLNEFSKYYRTYSNVLEIRLVSAEYLIAMKLCSGRKYKNDLSDIVGILAEHKRQGTPITFDDIDNAVRNLYNSWDKIPEDSKTFIKDVLDNGDYDKIYDSIREEEKNSKDILINFEKGYPGVTTTSNVDDILNTLKDKGSQ